MSGFITICRWFSQRIEFTLGPKNRRFDRERNADIHREMLEKVDELGGALEVGLGAKELCVEIGACAMMMAFNLEKGLGEEAVAAPITYEPPPPPALVTEVKPAPPTPPPPPGTKGKPHGQQKKKAK